MNVCQRNFGCRYKKQFRVGNAKRVLFELGQLPGSRHDITIDEERRQHLLVSPFPRVQIQHEIDQGPLQPCSGAFVESEASTGELGSASEIKNSQLLTNIPDRKSTRLNSSHTVISYAV